MTFTIEQLEALKEGTTPGPWNAVIRAQVENEGGEYSLYAEVCDQEEFPLMYAEDAFVYHREANFHLAAASPALLDQLIAREAELQQLKTKIETLADWHGIKAMKARDFPWTGERHEARFQGKAETHEVARDKLTQILEETND